MAVMSCSDQCRFSKLRWKSYLCNKFGQQHIGISDKSNHYIKVDKAGVSFATVFRSRIFTFFCTYLPLFVR